VYNTGKSQSIGSGRIFRGGSNQSRLKKHDAISLSYCSDGVRNHARIGAGIDCDKGNYEAGITAMERLLTAESLMIALP
jgi:hypothetical protein